MSYDEAPPPWEGQRGSSRRPNQPGARGRKPVDGYVEVKDRIRAFYAKYPEGRIQSEVVPGLTLIQEVVVETKTRNGKEYLEAHGIGYVAVKAYAYRTPDDPLPATGLSGMFLPGRTDFTYGTELENAETSAWGRALANLDILNDSGIASRDEVRNARGEDEDDAAAAAYEAAQATASPESDTGAPPSGGKPAEAPTPVSGAPEGTEAKEGANGLSAVEFVRLVRDNGIDGNDVTRVRIGLYRDSRRIADLTDEQRADLWGAILEDKRLAKQEKDDA
jgi:hypothetical protein